MESALAAAGAKVRQVMKVHYEPFRSAAKPQGGTPYFIDMNADLQSLIVNAPIAEVYRRCLEVERLPEFITSISKVDRISPTRFLCTWIRNGAQLTTDVEIIMRVPERRIAWQAVSDDFRIGVAFFDSLLGGMTRITVKVRSIVEPIALTGAMRRYLRNFKRLVEADQS